MVFPAPGYGLFRPVKVPGERRLIYAEGSMLHLMIPLTGVGGEHVVLPIVQLFGVILKTRHDHPVAGDPLAGVVARILPAGGIADCELGTAQRWAVTRLAVPG